MASPNAIFTEMVTTTLRQHPKMLADNMSNHNALWRRLIEKGNVKRIDGGYSIVEPLEYAENETFGYYSGYETLNIAASDVMSAAEFQWKQAFANVTASGLELRNNSGKNKLIDLAESRTKNALKTIGNKLSQGIYSDGTGSGGKQIDGIQALISDTGLNTVGGINSSTYPFWRNKVQSAAAPLQGGGAITVSKSTIQSLMLPLFLELTRGSDKPDLIVADRNYYTFYHDSLNDLQRYTSSKDASGGFQSLKYMSADVVFDSAASGMPANRMYFKNTDYIRLVMHQDADIKVSEERNSVNQDAVVIPILFQGNMTVSNRSLQGILKS